MRPEKFFIVVTGRGRQSADFTMEGTRMAETKETEEQLIRQLENPYLTAGDIERIKQKLEVIAAHKQ